MCFLVYLKPFRFLFIPKNKTEGAKKRELPGRVEKPQRKIRPGNLATFTNSASQKETRK